MYTQSYVNISCQSNEYKWKDKDEMEKKTLGANISKSCFLHFKKFHKIGKNSDRLLLGIILNYN